jgi:hypothetical protein
VASSDSQQMTPMAQQQQQKRQIQAQRKHALQERSQQQHQMGRMMKQKQQSLEEIRAMMNPLLLEVFQACPSRSLHINTVTMAKAQSTTTRTRVSAKHFVVGLYIEDPRDVRQIDKNPLLAIDPACWTRVSEFAKGLSLTHQGYARTSRCRRLSEHPPCG